SVFFFQAEDGIRDDLVTGVQTCALPICVRLLIDGVRRAEKDGADPQTAAKQLLGEVQLELHVAMRDIADVRMGKGVIADLMPLRSEERRVGKGCRLGWRRSWCKIKDSVL